MLGKKYNKAKSWIGKAVRTVDKANTWVGKSIRKAENLYSDVKHKAIEYAPLPLKGAVRESLFILEHNPISNMIVDTKDFVKLKQKELGDVIHSKELKNFLKN